MQLINKIINSKTLVRVILVFLILISNIGCDYYSKNLVRKNIQYNERINLIDNYLTLTKVENTGAFLSFGNDFPAPVKFVLMKILPLVILFGGIVFLIIKKNITNLTVVGICLIIGGGLGNIYDRIVYGSVTDFLHIDFIIFQTGIFNFADFSIMLGMFILIFEMFFIKKKISKPVTENNVSI